MTLLEPSATVALIVDVQEKLTPVMFERDRLVHQLGVFAACLRILEIPTLWTEQIPEKLGPTIPELRPLMTATGPISKHHFGCMGEPRVVQEMTALGRTRVLLCGIECHVCVCQTALQLITRGYSVDIVSDAVSSRTELNRRVGLERMQAAGATITSVECAIFELMGSASHPAFRDILRIVK